MSKNKVMFKGREVKKGDTLHHASIYGNKQAIQIHGVNPSDEDNRWTTLEIQVEGEKPDTVVADVIFSNNNHCLFWSEEEARVALNALFVKQVIQRVWETTVENWSQGLWLKRKIDLAQVEDLAHELLKELMGEEEEENDDDQA